MTSAGKHLIVWPVVAAAIGGAVWFALSLEEDPIPPPPLPKIPIASQAVLEVIRYERQAIEDNPTSVVGWGRFGMFCDAHDLIEEAVVCYQVAARLEPENFVWPYHEALCRPADEPDVLIERLERARVLRGSYAPLNIRLGRQYLMVDDPDSARECYEAVLPDDPNYSHALWGLARIAADSGDLEGSKNLLETAAELKPDHREVQALLASVLDRLGDKPGAEAARQRAEALGTGRTPIVDPERDQVAAFGDAGAIVFEQAALQRRAENFDRAIGMLRMALQDREDGAIRLELLFAEAQKAEQAYNRFENPPNRSRMVDAAANLLWHFATYPDEKIRNKERAMRALQDIEKLVRRKQMTVFHLQAIAAGYAINGKFDEAIQAEKELIAKAESLNDPAFLERARKRLASYENKTPWIATGPLQRQGGNPPGKDGK